MTRKTPKDPVRRERRHQKYSDAIYDLYDRTCHLCGKSGGDTIDHIVPVAWGGADHPANLKPAHRSCNSSKGADQPARWTYTKPVMWLPGYGANVPDTVRVPHWDYAGVRTFMFFLLLGAMLWWTGNLAHQGTLSYLGFSLIALPIAYNLGLLWWWRRACRTATGLAHADEEIQDPKAWLDDAFARR